MPGDAKRDQVSPADHWVCVQSVVVDGDSLWVLDPAAPEQATLVPGGPKLVQIDLASNQVVRTIAFDSRRRAATSTTCASAPTAAMPT